eukprot:GEMP01009847.1.p1 GENE.GEMP01009847.1~~GEMP01009847.1.p1  ORF type:complete len:758 (+),score=152.63 GEMP01009847.1:265-2538(+)
MWVSCAILFIALPSTRIAVVAASVDTECRGDPQCYCRSNCATHHCTVMCNSDPTNWTAVKSSIITDFPPIGAFNTTGGQVPPLPADVMTYEQWFESSGADRRRLKKLPAHFDFMNEERPDCEVEIRMQKNACQNCYDMAVHYMTSFSFCRRLERPFIASASYLTQCHDRRSTMPCARSVLGLLAPLGLLKDRSMVDKACLPGAARPRSRTSVPACATACRAGPDKGTPLKPPIPPSLVSYIVIEGGEAVMRRALLTQGSISVIMYVDDGPFQERELPLDAEPYTCKDQGATFPTTAVHALCMYGWGETRGGMPYWTFVNSWGAHWGDKGRSRIRRGKDDCYIESTQKTTMTFTDERVVPNPPRTPKPGSNDVPVINPPPPPPPTDIGSIEKANKSFEDWAPFKLGILILFVFGGLILITCVILMLCYFFRWHRRPPVAQEHGAVPHADQEHGAVPRAVQEHGAVTHAVQEHGARSRASVTTVKSAKSWASRKTATTVASSKGGLGLSRFTTRFGASRASVMFKKMRNKRRERNAGTRSRKRGRRMSTGDREKVEREDALRLEFPRVGRNPTGGISERKRSRANDVERRKAGGILKARKDTLVEEGDSSPTSTGGDIGKDGAESLGVTIKNPDSGRAASPRKGRCTRMKPGPGTRAKAKKKKAKGDARGKKSFLSRGRRGSSRRDDPRGKKKGREAKDRRDSALSVGEDSVWFVGGDSLRGVYQEEEGSTAKGGDDLRGDDLRGKGGAPAGKGYQRRE